MLGSSPVDIKLTVKASLEHFCNQVMLLETDSKVTQAYINMTPQCVRHILEASTPFQI